MDNPFGMQRGGEGGAKQTIFHFIKTFGFNPFDQEYEVRDKKGKLVFKITKKGIPQPLFNAMIHELNLHDKKQATAMKKK